MGYSSALNAALAGRRSGALDGPLGRSRPESNLVCILFRRNAREPGGHGTDWQLASMQLNTKYNFQAYVESLVYSIFSQSMTVCPTRSEHIERI